MEAVKQEHFSPAQRYTLFFSHPYLQLFNIFSQSKCSLFIYVFPSRYNVSLSGNERIPLSLRLASTKQTEIFITLARTAQFSFLFVGLPGLSQYECYYGTSHEYFPGPTIGTITLSLDFFVPPISLRINIYLDVLPTVVMRYQILIYSKWRIKSNELMKRDKT